MLAWRRTVLLACLLISTLCFANTAWIHAKAWLAQFLIERAWQTTLVSQQHTRPWPWADFWPVARLTMELDDRELFVLSSASGEALAFGPGHVNGSAQPGSEGTSIIAGHRDTHFQFLSEINPGGGMIVERLDGESTRYRVIEKRVVDSRNEKLHIAQQTMLILVTCYPFGEVLPGGPQRLVVRLLETGPG